MPRKRRDFIPGFAYHVTQRGNRKADTFFDDTDRHVYMRLLAKNCKAEKVRIWSYSLMDNHVHHIAVPEREDSLSRAFQGIHGSFANYFNVRHLKTGHLWQGRFKACLLDEAHLWNAVRYVERNPVRAGLVERAEDYRWSSAAAHCGRRPDPILSDDLPLIGVVSDWASWLSIEEKKEDLEFISSRARMNRPCASDEFVRKLEAQFGISLLPKKPGPKKSQAIHEPVDTGQKNLGFE
jgi:putative transposase